MVDRYEAWVRKEASWYLPLLDSLKSFTIFLPGRFDQNLLQSEAIYTGLNLVGLYHDTIAGKPRGPTFDIQCGPETLIIKHAKNVLGVLELTEVFIEMAASRYFERKVRRPRGRWAVILMVETVKAYCRLLMLANNGWKITTIPSADDLEEVTRKKMLETGRKKLLEQYKTNPGPCPEVSKMYIDHYRCEQNPHGTFVGKDSDVSLISASPATPQSAAAEVFHITRPVAYVFLRMMKKNPRSWQPLLVSLLFDMASRLLTPKYAFLNHAQREEISRRTMLYFLYLARSPLFERYIRGFVMRLSAMVSSIPIFGPLVSSIIDLLISLQVHYFYTSGS